MSSQYLVGSARVGDTRVSEDIGIINPGSSTSETKDLANITNHSPSYSNQKEKRKLSGSQPRRSAMEGVDGRQAKRKLEAHASTTPLDTRNLNQQPSSTSLLPEKSLPHLVDSTTCLTTSPQLKETKRGMRNRVKRIIFSPPPSPLSSRKPSCYSAKTEAENEMELRPAKAREEYQKACENKWAMLKKLKFKRISTNSGPTLPLMGKSVAITNAKNGIGKIQVSNGPFEEGEEGEIRKRAVEEDKLEEGEIKESNADSRPKKRSRED
ncbi:hypothetical protein C8Q75DRAFT_812103 [Abortiporus biennis]|nr:hypothetical protein C8Q75DRAFT_812103 [Abortiporus biennis]